MTTFSRTEIDFEKENSANKLFVCLFYLTFIFYDVFLIFIKPIVDPGSEAMSFRGTVSMTVYIVTYVIVIALLPISIWLVKKKSSPFAIKYLYFGVFLAGSLVNEIIKYYGTDDIYASGSPVELFFVLFSPIFVNRTYYILVATGFTFKYTLMGLYTHSPVVIFPIMLLLLFSAVTFIILNRFNSYLNTVEKSYEHAVQNEKLAFIGRIATGVTHEIKNPLTSLKGFVQLQEAEQEYNPKYSKIMLQELDRLNIIVNDLMVLGKPQAINHRPVSLNDIVQYVVNLMRKEADNNDITIDIDCNQNQIQILGDDGRLKQVLLNILKNAMEAMPDGGKIRIKLFKDNDLTTLQVIDSGVGIVEEEIPNLEEAFYSTKENGTGLGLMVSYKIVEEHKGRINIDSEVGVGTTFCISFPTHNTI